MDPTVAYYTFQKALINGDNELAWEYYWTLYDWLAKGGFNPTGMTTDVRQDFLKLYKHLPFLCEYEVTLS